MGLNFDVSDIVFGTYKAGGTDWGAINDFDTVDTIKYAVDNGVNLIDTATGYGMGRAERVIRYALDDEGGARRGTPLNSASSTAIASEPHYEPVPRGDEHELRSDLRHGAVRGCLHRETGGSRGRQRTGRQQRLLRHGRGRRRRELDDMAS